MVLYYLLPQNSEDSKTAKLNVCKTTCTSKAHKYNDGEQLRFYRAQHLSAKDIVAEGVEVDHVAGPGAEVEHWLALGVEQRGLGWHDCGRGVKVKHNDNMG